MERSDLTRWRGIYGEFMETLAKRASLSAILPMAESLTGCTLAVTDEDGSVLHSSPGYRGGPYIEPPPLTEVLNSKYWRDDRAVATPIIQPGRWFVWLASGADPGDQRQRACLFMVSELTYLLKSFNMPPIPPEWQARSHLLERMLFGSGGDRVRTDAQRLGWDIDRTTHLIAVRSIDEAPGKQIARALGLRFRRLGLLASRNDHLIIVVNGEHELESVLSILTGMPDVGPLQIGVSAPQPDGLDLSRALDQAIAAATRPGKDTIVRFAEQDPVAVIAHLADRVSIELFTKRALGPLLDYDGSHRDELLVTLRAWLDATDSLEAIADRLHIHKNTLTYRIRRIRELLGDDLLDGSRRFETSLALRLLEHDDARTMSEATLAAMSVPMARTG